MNNNCCCCPEDVLTGSLTLEPNTPLAVSDPRITNLSKYTYGLTSLAGAPPGVVTATLVAGSITFTSTFAQNVVIRYMILPAKV